MTKLQTLIDATQALLVSFKNSSISSGSTYDDAAIELARVRVDQSESAVSDFCQAVEALVSHLDDISQSNSPEWEAASLALDALLGRNQSVDS